MDVPYVNIYKTRIETGSTAPLTSFSPAGHANRNPEFSPDGTKIAFSTDRTTGNGFDVYVMSADGSGQTPVAATTAAEDQPRWANHSGYAGGARLTYISGSATHDVRMVDADATDDSLLVSTPDDDTFADLQPMPDCSIVWDGGAATDDWDAATNWDLDRVPGAGDKVCIPEMQASVTVSQGTGIPNVASVVTHENVTISGGTLTTGSFTAMPGASVTVAGGRLNATAISIRAGAFTVTGAGIAALETLQATDDAALAITGGTLTAASIAADPDVPMTLDGGTLSGAVTFTSGTFEWPDTGATFGTQPWTIGSNTILELTTADGDYWTASGTGLINEGTLDLGSALRIHGDGTLANASGATVVKDSIDPAHGTNISVAFDNDGLLSVPSGIVEVSGGDGTSPAVSSDSGTFDTGDDGAVHFTAGRTNLGHASALTGTGGFAVTNAELNVGSHGVALPTGGTLELNSGALSGSGPLTGGTFVWKDGLAIANPGSFTIGDGAMLDLATDAGEYQLPAGGGLTNNGTINLNTTGRIWGDGPLVNTGLIRKTAPDNTTQLSTTFDNQGRVSAVSGTIGLPSSMTSNGTPAYDGANKTFRGGTYRAGNGGTLTFSGATEIVDNAATFELTGSGAVRDDTASVFRNLAANSGTLTLQSGAALATNAALTNTGTVVVDSDSTLSAPAGYTQSGAGAVTRLEDTTENGTAARLVTAIATFAAGRLEGNGSIVGDLVNNGATLTPGNSAGTLMVTGDFEQLGGTLEAEIFGRSAGAFDTISVGGTAELLGSLHVVTTGFAAAWNDEFPLVTAGGGMPTVAFTSIEGALLPSGMSYSAKAVGNDLRLTVDDTVKPTNATPSSTTHTRSVWSRDRTVDVKLTGAADAHSGVDGYAVVWDTVATTVPQRTKRLEQGATKTTSPALPTGKSHYVHIRTKDNEGNWSGTAHFGPFWIDATAPTGGGLTTPATTISTSLATKNSSPQVKVAWTKTADSHSGLRGGVAGNTVRYRSTANGTSWTSKTKSLAATSRSFAARGRPGTTYCFKATRRDKVGNAATTAQRCASVPFNDTAFTKAKRWTAPKANGYYLGSAARSTVTGATLTKKVSAKSFSLVATRCSGCGSVRVYFKGKPIGKVISLHTRSKTPLHKRVIPVGTLKSATRGTLVVKVVSSGGRPVVIDGVATNLR